LNHTARLIVLCDLNFDKVLFNQLV